MESFSPDNIPLIIVFTDELLCLIFDDLGTIYKSMGDQSYCKLMFNSHCHSRMNQERQNKSPEKEFLQLIP